MQGKRSKTIFLTWYFVLGYSQFTNSAVIVSGEQGRGSATHTHVSILPQTPPTQAATEHRAEFNVLYSRSLLLIHFKYSTVYTLIPNSTMLSPILSPGNHSMFIFNFSLYVSCHSSKDFKALFSKFMEKLCMSLTGIQRKEQNSK